MYGDVQKQVSRLFKVSAIYQPKTSKHEERLRARAAGAKTSHQINKKTSIYSWGHFKKVESTVRQFAVFQKERGMGDLEKVSNRGVEKFLMEKIDKGVSHKHFQNLCSHFTKLEASLNRYCKEEKFNFDRVIDRCKEVAKDSLEKNIQARAYDNPKAILLQIKDEKHELVARLQYEGGARIREACLITEDRLGSLKIDKISGREIGTITLQGSDTKGGKGREIIIEKETFERLSRFIQKEKQLYLDATAKNIYRAELKAAAEATGQRYTGSHGLRHNYAQERMNTYQEKGVGYHAACRMVSQEMGHERPSITEWYLR
ncbi:MAG: site-specific integrase [Desulfamplus sp.]|nr:site-specific integrase [Desulfamplus sp.]